MSKYTKRIEGMTSKQRKQLAAILLKEGEQGWVIERLGKLTKIWNIVNNLHEVDCSSYRYRAVGPRKRVDLKRGMEVKKASGLVGLLLTDQQEPEYIFLWCDGGVSTRPASPFTHYRWPNLETDWLPIEGESEIISMEGVE